MDWGVRGGESWSCARLYLHMYGSIHELSFSLANAVCGAPMQLYKAHIARDQREAGGGHGKSEPFLCSSSLRITTMHHSIQSSRGKMDGQFGSHGNT